MLASSSGLKVLHPEYDGDLELYFDGDVAYVQIKDCSDPHQPSNVSDILLRFDALRQQHSSGRERGGLTSRYLRVLSCRPHSWTKLSSSQRM